MSSIQVYSLERTRCSVVMVHTYIEFLFIHIMCVCVVFSFGFSRRFRYSLFVCRGWCVAPVSHWQNPNKCRWIRLRQSPARKKRISCPATCTKPDITYENTSQLTHTFFMKKLNIIYKNIYSWHYWWMIKIWVCLPGPTSLALYAISRSVWASSVTMETTKILTPLLFALNMCSMN